jgi:hypothetical protein
VEKHIIAPLRENGIVTWYSKNDIQVADKWERQIVEGIKASSVLVLVMSPHAAQSEWVRDEVNFALEYLGDSCIVPVLITSCRADDFHIRVCRLQYLDFRTDPKAAAQQLIRILLRQPASKTPAVPPGKKLQRVGALILATLVFLTILTLVSLAGLTIAGFTSWKNGRLQFNTAESNTLIDKHQDQPTAPRNIDQQTHPYTIQVRFVSPDRMRVSWLIKADEQMKHPPPLPLPGSDIHERPKVGPWAFSRAYLEVPARYNFNSGNRYRLKFSSLPDLVGLETYPTIEVRHNPTNDALKMLNSSVIPIELTLDDFRMVAKGTEVIKVWYLNKAGKLLEFRQSASSQTDPLVDAAQLGIPLVIFRMTNVDLENPNTPPTDDP